MKLTLKIDIPGPNARDAFLRDLQAVLLKHTTLREGKITITQEAEIFPAFPINLALLGVDEEPPETPIERAINELGKKP